MTNLIYGFFILLSFSVPFMYIYFSSDRVSRKNVLEMELISFVSAVFGAVIYTLIVSFAHNGKPEFGLSSVGAVLGMGLSLYLYGNLKPFDSLNKVTNKLVLCVPLMYGISKCACLFKGCCDGEILGIKIQLVEIVSFIALFIVCLLFLKDKPFAVMAVSAFFKMMIEFGRYEPSRENQCVSAAICSLAIAMILNKRTEWFKDVRKTKLDNANRAELER